MKANGPSEQPKSVWYFFHAKEARKEKVEKLIGKDIKPKGKNGVDHSKKPVNLK